MRPQTPLPSTSCVRGLNCGLSLQCPPGCSAPSEYSLAALGNYSVFTWDEVRSHQSIYLSVCLSSFTQEDMVQCSISPRQLIIALRCDSSSARIHMHACRCRISRARLLSTSSVCSGTFSSLFTLPTWYCSCWCFLFRFCRLYVVCLPAPLRLLLSSPPPLVRVLATGSTGIVCRLGRALWRRGTLRRLKTPAKSARSAATVPGYVFAFPSSLCRLVRLLLCLAWLDEPQKLALPLAGAHTLACSRLVLAHRPLPPRHRCGLVDRLLLLRGVAGAEVCQSVFSLHVFTCV